MAVEGDSVDFICQSTMEKAPGLQEESLIHRQVQQRRAEVM